MNKIKILAIVGKSGAGKDYILKCLKMCPMDKINIGCFDPMRLDILSDDRGIDLKIVYITATDKERLIRQLTRENSPDVDEILRRYFADNDDFKYLDLDHDIYEIPNHDGEADQVCQKILDIVEHWDNLD